MTRLAVILCVVSLVATISSKQIQDSVPKFCSKTVPDYTECTLKMFRHLGPYLLKGIPRMKISMFYPVEIPLIEVESDHLLLQVQANITDVLFYGWNEAKIKNISINPDDMSGNITMTIPTAQMFLQYDALGRMLHIPLVSRGHFEGNFTKVDTHFNGNFREVYKNETKYFALENFSVKTEIAYAVTTFTAKDPNDQFAADVIQNFFNEDPVRFLDISYSLWNEVCYEYYRKVIERALTTVPVKTFFRT